jgi:hypothetical protein
MGATSFGANGDIAFVRGTDIVLRSATTVVNGSGGHPATNPSFSADGTKIAFVQDAQIKTCTVTASCTGTQVGSLTGTEPVWSPDGSKLAYVSVTGEIHVADSSNGGNDVTVTSPGANANPSWVSATQIVFTRGTSIVISGIGDHNGDSAAAVTITNITGAPSQPAVSPDDGATIAFEAGAHVYVVPVGGGAATLVNGSESETAPSWSPDGNTIAYATPSGIKSVTRAGSTWGSPEQQTNGVDLTPDWQTIVPQNATPPSITGGAAPQTGQLLSVTNGSWSGAKTFTYEWRRCDSSADNCSAVAGATFQTYAVASADIGHTLRVAVKASNAAGESSEAVSNATGVVTQAGTVTPPSNTSYPSVSLGFGQSAPLVGTTVTASNGTWTGTFPMTFTYQWKRCDGKFGPCFAITGAKSSFFTVGAAQYGFALRVEVTATNSAGSVSQNSEATPLVTAVAPFLRVTPQITNARPTVDQSLSVSTGTWDGTPAPTFTYSWRRCNAPGDVPSCVQIPGATLVTYTPKVDDIGSTIRVWVTGTNQAGTALAITNHTFPVVDKAHFAPRAVSSPAIVGTLGIGRQLTASTGSYDGDDPIKSVFVWQRCDATGASCKTLPGKTKITYSPTKVDIGFTLRLSVTVTNAYGKLVAMSDPTEPVAMPQPHRKGRRIIGKPRNDYIAGGGFDDVILGMRGSDTILGGAGDDKLDGGPGNDIITGGSGADQLFGGTGSDTIYAADGERDVITCGAGRDRAVVDSADKVDKDCEVVQTGVSTPTPTTPGETTPTPGETTPTPRRR